MWPFRKRKVEQPQEASQAPSGETLLLNSFLENERVRIEKAAELEAQKHALEMERTKLELADLERIGAEKRKQQLFNEQLREQKRATMAKAREAKRQKGLAATAQPQASLFADCEECQALSEGRPPRHSSHLILHTQQNHQARFGN